MTFLLAIGVKQQRRPDSFWLSLLFSCLVVLYFLLFCCFVGSFVVWLCFWAFCFFAFCYGYFEHVDILAQVCPHK